MTFLEDSCLLFKRKMASHSRGLRRRIKTIKRNKRKKTRKKKRKKEERKARKLVLSWKILFLEKFKVPKVSMNFFKSDFAS